MRIVRLAAVLAAAAAVSACATSGGPRDTSSKTPPTPYVRITDKNPFGVTHATRPDGWTEVLARMNENSPRERAREMALYYAARLGRKQNANSIYIAAEESDVYCHVTQHRGPGVVVIGNPIAMLASLAFTAASTSTTIAESFEAYPFHVLLVSLSKSVDEAEGMVRLPVAETLAALQAKFEPAPADAGKAATAKKRKKARTPAYTEEERKAWAADAARNVAVCTQRYEQHKAQQKAMKQQRRKRGKRRAEEKTPQAETPPAAGETGAAVEESGSETAASGAEGAQP